jgi:hypothetical protein
MAVQLLIFNRETSQDTNRRTSSRALEAGRSLSDSPDCQRISQHGVVAVHVLHSQPQGRKRNVLSVQTECLSRILSGPEFLSAVHADTNGLPTTGTYGLSFSGSSASANLNSFLESRYQALMDVYGSQEYALAWKQWDMAFGPSILALRASTRHTSGKGSSGEPCGWGTPVANDDNKSMEAHLAMKARMGGNRTAITSLQVQAQLVGWPSPNTPSGGRSISIEKMDATGRTADGKKHTASLEHAVKFAGWTTPQAHDVSPRGQGQKAKHGTKHGCADLNADVALVGWNSPRATDGSNGGPNQAGGALSADASLAGWPTCTTRDHKDGTAKSCENVPENALLGRVAHLSNAETAKSEGYRLNPFFSLWLQGYPPLWGICGIVGLKKLKSKKSSKRRKASRSREQSPEESGS